MLQTLKPKIFRWHIPFDDTMIPGEWKPWLATYFNSYYLVVVSSKRYLASLKAFGHTGKVVRMYPYVDPDDYSQPPAEDVEATCAGRGIPSEAVVILVVGRMDPMKGQDRAIRAFARVAQRFPLARLVLVGNGSFSGAQGPAGQSKSARWRGGLESLAHELGVKDRVLFTGHVTQKELDCLYERARFTLLPSVQEGFGLVVVESWLHRKPTVVTERAGIAELIDPGTNGFLVDPDDTDALVEKLEQLLTLDADALDRLGKEGYKTSKKCVVDTAVKAETKILLDITGA
jgi:glycosyltransferase involved in cell wall biosynthesis